MTPASETHRLHVYFFWHVCSFSPLSLKSGEGGIYSKHVINVYKINAWPADGAGEWGEGLQVQGRNAGGHGRGSPLAAGSLTFHFFFLFSFFLIFFFFVRLCFCVFCLCILLGGEGAFYVRTWNARKDFADEVKRACTAAELIVAAKACLCLSGVNDFCFCFSVLFFSSLMASKTNCGGLYSCRRVPRSLEYKDAQR